jgi:hypothetical protein
VDFYKNMRVKGVRFNFQNPSQCKHGPNMFTSVSTLLQRIHNLLPFTMSYVQSLDSKAQLEYDMFTRLEQAAGSQNMSFRRNITNGDTIDLFINDVPIQAKFRSLPARKCKIFDINLQKGAGRLTQKGKGFVAHLRQPYHINDPFKCVIIELGGDSGCPTKYHNQFCIIPKSVLVNRGYLTSDVNKGKHKMCVCPPDYNGKHWSKQYWNRWDLLDSTIKTN